MTALDLEHAERWMSRAGRRVHYTAPGGAWFLCDSEGQPAYRVDDNAEADCSRCRTLAAETAGTARWVAVADGAPSSTWRAFGPFADPDEAALYAGRVILLEAP